MPNWLKMYFKILLFIVAFLATATVLMAGPALGGWAGTSLDGPGGWDSGPSLAVGITITVVWLATAGIAAMAGLVKLGDWLIN